jgi:hypothetical protein
MSYIDELIVPNGHALAQKYKAAGKTALENAIKKLIKADATRGIVTVYVDISDATTMASYGTATVPAGGAGNAKTYKKAIDKVFNAAAVRPQYLMLLGAQDVIPHAPLKNPVPGDGDDNVPSDLPYASDKPYSTDVQDLISPARVVGRLPNVLGDKDPEYLLGLIRTATEWKPRPATAYGSFLGISARVWQESSNLSLDAIFGTHAGIKLAPPKGYKWTAAEARRLAHFVNCHGAPATPFFYGQEGTSYPEAHSAAWMAGKVVEGTVMAAECCYGAELYDPSLPTAGGQMGICNTYLGGKAYAYLGSSTIAYGPSDGNDEGDLICQNFLRQILAGASTGRACLQARLEYIRSKSGVLTPTDLKTLAQFNLMADPAVTPVEHTHGAAVPFEGARKEEVTTEILRHARVGRRDVLEAVAKVTTSYRLVESHGAAPGKVSTSAKVRRLAADRGIIEPNVILHYLVEPASHAANRHATLASAPPAGAVPKAIHVTLDRGGPRDGLPVILNRGVQEIEYENAIAVKYFTSR